MALPSVWFGSVSQFVSNLFDSELLVALRQMGERSVLPIPENAYGMARPSSPLRGASAKGSQS